MAPADALVQQICRAVERGDDGEVDRLIGRLAPLADLDQLMELRSCLEETLHRDEPGHARGPA